MVSLAVLHEDYDLHIDLFILGSGSPHPSSRHVPRATRGIPAAACLLQSLPQLSGQFLRLAQNLVGNMFLIGEHRQFLTRLNMAMGYCEDARR